MSALISLPEFFTFYHGGAVNFDKVIERLDLNPQGSSVVIDTTACTTANFQALALLIQYAWFLTINGYEVTFKYGTAASGSTKMLHKMGALNWRDVLLDDGRDFDSGAGRRTYALRRRSDVQNTINFARRAIGKYSVQFPEYLSYIVSELLYNATEHGKRPATVDGCRVMVPSVFTFGYYPMLGRLSFIFSDLGIGVKAHLEQAYPPFAGNPEAIIYALRPNVSGTFGAQTDPYAAKNNAGLGLTYSSLMLKRLKADMYIVSQDGVVHVSPEDVTSRRLKQRWPGTFVLINLNMNEALDISLSDLLSEIRKKAEAEMEGATANEEENSFYVGIFNYFGKYAEDKDAAIAFRDRHMLPAVDAKKRIGLDFKDVETAPHSFLNALLATAVQRFGLKAYQQIRIYNANSSIREIIDGILESNTPRLQ